MRRALAMLAAAGVACAHTALAAGIPPLLTVRSSDKQSLPSKDIPRAPETFSAEEITLRQALDAAVGIEQKAEAARRLAGFYLRYDLNVEALAALQATGLPPDDPEARLLKAEAQYSLGRFGETVETLGGEGRAPEGSALALYGMALARLGAFERGAQALAASDSPPARRFAVEFHLMRAIAALAVDKADAAALALRAAQPIDPASPLRREAAYYESLMQVGREDFGPARESWRALAKTDDAIGARAALKVLEDDVNSGARPRGEALEAARAISLRWRGGETEREALLLIGALLGDTPEAFETLQRLAEDHPDADAATVARERLGAMMTRLAVDNRGLSSAAKARLFYEMIDYAPPGAEGDALIRTVAGRLRDLDLLAEAAELLEHQVFTRLRGKERAVIAADLADLYLDDGKPADARRVIASTRMAGLDAKTDRRRLLLEATAYFRIDDGDGALALLEDVETPEAGQLRAGIYWSQRDWPRAAEAYRAAAIAAPVPLSDEGREDVLRAATAYLLAADETGFSAFNAEISRRIGADAAARLLDALADEAKTAGAMDAYRQLYLASGSGS